MTVRWITPLLGTAPAAALDPEADVAVLDVRELVDRAGNNPDRLREKILTGVALLRDGRKTVICCDHGISRSNAIAAGILSQAEDIPLRDAIRRVIAATGEHEMRPDVLEAVQRALPDSADTRDRRQGKQRWLLTGGSGSLGTLISATAPENIEIVRPSRSELDLLHGSVNLGLYADETGISRILHFASPRIGNTNVALGEALVMLRSVLEAASTRDLPVLMPSRWEVFAGYSGETLIATEDTPQKPAGVLGDTKYLLESLARAWTDMSRARVTILRSALVFGQGLAPHFLRTFMRKAQAGEPITTHLYDDGQPLLDLMEAEDWISAFWALTRSDEPGLFQAGGGDLVGTRQLAEMVEEASGRGCQVGELPVEGKAANVRLDSGRLQRLTGWKPSGPVRNLLADFLNRAYKDRTFT